MATTIAVQPQVFYDAAAALHTAAENLFTVVDGKWDALADCEHMAGTYDEAQKWAASYDQHAYDAMNTAVHAAEAIDNYAGVLREMGYNHALADYNATIGDKGSPPEKPAAPTPAVYSCRVPLPSAGGPSNGLEDGGVKLAEKIGITVPNGDTGKLGKISTAWAQLAAAEAVANLPAEIERVHGMFSVIRSPETDFISTDLEQLKSAATTVAGAFGALSAACAQHHDALNTLREDLKTQLEELGQELLKELAITAAIGVVTSFVTFGIGAAVASAKVAEIAARFAAPIRGIIDAWKAGHKLEKGIKLEQDLAKSTKELQDLSKLGEEIKKPPTIEKAPAPARVDPAGWTGKDNDALLDYTTSGGRELNAALRDGRVEGSDALKFRVDNVNEALGKLPDYKGVVTRRVDSKEMPPDVLARYQPGKTVTEDGFTSTSRAPEGTPFPGDVEFQIFSKSGKDITEYAQPEYRREQEVLFRSGTPFDVTERFTDPATGHTVIRMVEH
ncbi:ADP-ribosyltransferase [Nocardia sp. AB354]|uniref:ADP-ribosyltransferase n=1 Tax=Nocardia sp. AB354 TaxID=3413283 RepID=UPI003C14322A